MSSKCCGPTPNCPCRMQARKIFKLGVAITIKCTSAPSIWSSDPCPVWVISGHSAIRNIHFTPESGHSSGERFDHLQKLDRFLRVMSALGHQRTYAVQKGMPALPPKADMCGATRDVRFGPIADITSIRSLRQRGAGRFPGSSSQSFWRS